MLYRASSLTKNTRYPTIFVMLCALTATIAWHASYCTTIWYVIVLTCCIIFFITNSHSYKQTLLSIVLLSSLCTLGIQRYTHRVYQADALYKKLNKKKCNLRATVLDIEYTEGGRYRYVTTLSTEKINIIDTNTEWQPADHTVRVYTAKRPKVWVADITELENISIRKPNNPDFCRYLIKEGIAGTCFLHSGTFTLIARPMYSITRWLHTVRSQLMYRLNKALTPATALLFRSVFMGKRSNKNKHIKKLKKSCQAWGVSHHLARSGLHLIIIVLVWQLLLKILAISLYKRIGIILFFTFIYQLLTWSSISFFRALWAFLLHHVCIFFGIPSNSFYLLTLVALVTLLINPFYLFFLDFQLSFGTALALTWYNTVGRE